jgi:hypothetical protein
VKADAVRHVDDPHAEPGPANDTAAPEAEPTHRATDADL